MWITDVNGDQITEGKYQYRRPGWDGWMPVIVEKRGEEFVLLWGAPKTCPARMTFGLLPADAQLRREE